MFYRTPTLPGISAIVIIALTMAPPHLTSAQTDSSISSGNPDLGKIEGLSTSGKTKTLGGSDFTGTTAESASNTIRAKEADRANKADHSNSKVNSAGTAGYANTKVQNAGTAQSCKNCTVAANCGSATVSWGSCYGTTPTRSHGALVSVSESRTSGNEHYGDKIYGSATYKCVNGTWQYQGGYCDSYRLWHCYANSRVGQYDKCWNTEGPDHYCDEFCEGIEDGNGGSLRGGGGGGGGGGGLRG